MYIQDGKVVNQAISPIIINGTLMGYFDVEGEAYRAKETDAYFAESHSNNRMSFFAKSMVSPFVVLNLDTDELEVSNGARFLLGDGEPLISLQDYLDIPFVALTANEEIPAEEARAISVRNMRQYISKRNSSVYRKDNLVFLIFEKGLNDSLGEPSLFSTHFSQATLLNKKDTPQFKGYIRHYLSSGTFLLDIIPVVFKPLKMDKDFMETVFKRLDFKGTIEGLNSSKIGNEEALEFIRMEFGGRRLRGRGGRINDTF